MINLASVTSLLLLGVFTIVNVACLILRRDGIPEGRFRSPGITPAIAAVLCAFLARPVGRPRAASSTRSPPGCSSIGVVLWAFTWLTNRAVRAKKTGFRDIEHLEE